MAQTPHADKGLTCPLHKQDMSKVCHKCPWWTQLRGKHPQTGEDLDKWGCAIAFMPVLMIETTMQTRQAGAAIESFRNEMVNANTMALAVIGSAAGGHKLADDKSPPPKLLGS